MHCNAFTVYHSLFTVMKLSISFVGCFKFAGRGAVKQSSSFLFDYLCILNIIIVMYHRSLRTTTGKLEPVD